jgi:vitamin B12 transporter
MRLLSRKWSSSASAVAIAACVSFANGALAQQAVSLPEITVKGATLDAKRPQAAGAGSSSASTAGSSANSAGDGGVPADQIGAAVTVITGEDLRKQQVRTVADALRSLPGVAVSRTGNEGGQTQVRIRGAEGNHTLVIIDGIPANNATTGELDFSNLSVENIERIEVIRGPMSGLYGSNAVGGVINIVTRRGRGPLTATLQTEAGSFNTKDVVARMQAGNDKAYFSASYHWRDTDGFNIAPVGSEKDGSRLGAFSLRAGAMLAKDITADVSIQHTKKNAQIDGFGDFSAPSGTLATAFDEADRQKDTIFLVGGKVRWDMLGGQLSHELRANYNSTDMNNLSPFFNTTNSGVAQNFSYLGTYRFATPILGLRNSVSGLIEKGEESFTPSVDGIERSRNHLTVAGEWRGEFGKAVYVTANVRHDDNDTFEDFTTWRAAVSTPLPGLGLRPHASVGTAAKFPTMFEQFGFIPSTFTPNPDLRPERSKGWDAGVEFTFIKKVATLDMTYFRADLTDKIKTVFAGSTFTAVNLDGVSQREGVEIAARYQLMANLGIGLSYTYTNATDPDGTQEIRRPPHSGRVDLDYGFDQGRGTFRLAAAYNGVMTDTAFRLPSFDPVRVDIGNYWLVTAAAAYKLQPGVELFGRVENLLDAKYQEVYGYNTPGLTAFAGLRFTLGGPEGFGTPGKP